MANQLLINQRSMQNLDQRSNVNQIFSQMLLNGQWSINGQPMVND